MNEDAAVAGARDRLARLPLFAGRPLDTLTIRTLLTRPVFMAGKTCTWLEE